MGWIQIPFLMREFRFTQKQAGKEAGSLIQFMDELVAPCAAEFTAIYEQYFRQYGNKTVSELAADCAEMPETERQTVLYELLIHPFASLEEHPNKRYCP